MKARLYLAAAITAEIAGTSAMKYATDSGTLLGYLIMCVLISCSYILFSVSIKTIPLGLAYALWEGFGLLFITLISVVFFHEAIGFTKITGLIVLFIGILFLSHGADKKEASENHSAEQDNIHSNPVVSQGGR